MPAPTFLELARSIDRQLAGNINFPFRTIPDGASAITDNDFYLAIDAALGNAVITLPSAVTVKSGLGYRVIRVDSVLTNTVVIGTTGGQTINGGSSAAITLQYSVLDIVSDGTNWLLFASPSAYASSTDVLWTFPGTVADDQDDNLYTLLAARAMSFVGFDVNLNLEPTGGDLIVGWLVNGIVEPSAQITVPAGDRDATVTFAISLAQGDTLQPYVAQVGSLTPGLTMVIRARGT